MYLPPVHRFTSVGICATMMPATPRPEPIGLIDIGHFAGEHLVLGPLAEQLSLVEADHAGWSVLARVCETESDNF